VAPASVDALQSAILELAGDRARCEQLGTNGAITARTTFSLERMVRSTIQIYDDVSEGSG
jgi:hypothetical protein